MPDTRDVTIRPFLPEDQQAAKALVLAGLEEHWGRLDPTLNPDLDDIAAAYADGVFLVACHDDRVVGTGALIPEGDGAARIVRMSVAAPLRRQGVGTRILRRLLEQARADGTDRIVLETTSTWEDAIAFYRRHAFRVVGERDGDIHFVLDLEGRA